MGFIEGLQGDDPRYVKAMACAKHFAVHSGPEKSRHVFDATPSERDLYETYLPQFEAAVREAKVGTVMAAYNALDGVPAPASAFLLRDVLRGRWGFAGHVVSDCGAIDDVWARHRYVPTRERAAALSVEAGTDLECGDDYAALVGAVDQGLIRERTIDVALARVLTARFRLGLFDPPERCAYLRIPATENDTPVHGALALRTARESMTLLKNDGVLPLARAKVRRIALIGPNADSVDALLGNYNGDPRAPVTVRQGLLAAAGPGIDVTYAKGCPLALKPGEAPPDFGDALRAARGADVVVFAGGLDAHLEGEEMRSSYVGFDGGDRVRIELPSVQNRLLRALRETGKPGGVREPERQRDRHALGGGAPRGDPPGLVPGAGGVAPRWPTRCSGGRTPPGGFPSRSTAPPKTCRPSRTTRWRTGPTGTSGASRCSPFGHGLSYTRFAYGPPRLSASTLSPSGTMRVRVPVRNVGPVDGEEVVQLYVRRSDAKPAEAIPRPRRLPARRDPTGHDGGGRSRPSGEGPAALGHPNEALRHRPGSLRDRARRVVGRHPPVSAREREREPRAMIEIVPYRAAWKDEFEALGAALRGAVGSLALAIHHIGSTSVPGLDAKDVIDLQMTVASLDAPIQAPLAVAGFAPGR